LTRPEEEPEEKEEVVEHEAAFLDALKRLEAARTYINQFETMNSIIVISNKVKNELCSLRAQEKKNQEALTECLSKWANAGIVP
jgi:type I site-specific restriction-modification system R (restriction) subunit